jgi:hypothetical protein
MGVTVHFRTNMESDMKELMELRLRRDTSADELAQAIVATFGPDAALVVADAIRIVARPFGKAPRRN